MSLIFNNFKDFRHLPQDIQQNIKSFYANQCFGYWVTNDNKVYALGLNVRQLLSNESNDNYVEINELSDQNIQEFYQGYDGNWMFARNNQNQIFSWGENKYGQLAIGSTNDQYLRPQKIDFFDDKKIIYISCGRRHCLALSYEGNVYGWGQLTEEVQYFTTPVLIDFKSKVKYIHCSGDTSFAVTVEGSGYYWHKTCLFDFKLIPHKNISKISNCCDSGPNNHIIFLDNFGKVYIFNVLTEKTIIDNSKPDIIKSEVKFSDLCNDYYSCNCLLQSKDCVYKLIYENRIHRPIKTNFYKFYSFCSKNSRNYMKTIHITEEGILGTKEFEFNKRNKILSFEFNDRYVFDNKYETFFVEINKIGSGRYGEVFNVKQKTNNISYAIKRVEIREKNDLNEIQFISELNFDYVVKYIDSWIEGKILFSKINPYLFIQMELCEHNLEQFIKLMPNEESFQTFGYYISCELFKELTECVHYLHSLNPPIIHRDLKPENILISDGINGRFLKLCDFGLAKIHQISNHTRKVGTSYYMAPEVNSGIYNTKADIYSLAMIGTQIFQFSDDPSEVDKHTELEDFDKYLSEYSDTILITKFEILLKTLSNCLHQKIYNLRPDCSELLEKINEFSVDKNIVRKELNEENISRFQSFLRKSNSNNLFLKFFETKIRNQWFQDLLSQSKRKRSEPDLFSV